MERLRDGVEHRAVWIGGSDSSLYLVVHARHDLVRQKSFNDDGSVALEPVEQSRDIRSHVEALNHCGIGKARVGHVLILATVHLERIGEIPYLSPERHDAVSAVNPVAV
jgi:hypothetical protein